ncbi:MAG: hypothetical protein MUF00_00025 [Gemmatimonadaceae bacterium]|jgi:hypothetical protein|nr:hypothetical protein [Gemmatimonadaceae bacterium]
MRTISSFGAVAAFLVLASAVHAQAPAQAPASDRRDARRERVQEAREQWKSMTPEEREAAAARAKEQRAARLETLSPEGKAWVQSRDAEARRIATEVKAGTLTKAAGREQMKAWAAANPRPASLKPASTPN